MSKKKQVPTIRSGAAEYLTFVAATGQNGVNVIYADENVWLSQKMMAALYDVETPTINYHLKKIFGDGELTETAVIRNFLITAADGKTYDTKHYGLEAIIAVGYKVNSERAVQFRKWATHVLKDFAIQGWAMKPKMGLTTWEDAPDGKIQKFDVSVAKNYLTPGELEALSRIVSMYLDYAEDMAKRHIPMTMQDWETRLNAFLAFNERDILDTPGKVTREIAQAFAESEFEKYRLVQDRLFKSDFDRLLESSDGKGRT